MMMTMSPPTTHYNDNVDEHVDESVYEPLPVYHTPTITTITITITITITTILTQQHGCRHALAIGLETLVSIAKI